MTIYAKKVTSDHETFKGRATTIISGGPDEYSFLDVIPVPDNVTLCNGCNNNITEGYLIYLSKDKLKANQPYDYYCPACLHECFPKSVIIGGTNG